MLFQLADLLRRFDDVRMNRVHPDDGLFHLRLSVARRHTHRLNRLFDLLTVIGRLLNERREAGHLIGQGECRVRLTFRTGRDFRHRLGNLR